MQYKYTIKRLKDHLIFVHKYELGKKRISKLQGSPPDLHRYNPYFEPWHHNEHFQPYLELSKGVTVVGPESLWILVGLLKHSLQIKGDVVEMGVYKGGTAAIINRVLAEEMSTKVLLGYDTFDGMPETDPSKDHHKKSDFSNTSLESVREFIEAHSLGRKVDLYAGQIPESCVGNLPNEISFAHIDLDIYSAISSALAVIYSRVAIGGIILFDDYGAPTCYGARLAVDEFFADKKELPIVLTTSQAFVIKL